jgi:hypothetical protein
MLKYTIDYGNVLCYLQGVATKKWERCKSESKNFVNYQTMNLEMMVAGFGQAGIGVGSKQRGECRC